MSRVCLPCVTVVGLLFAASEAALAVEIADLVGETVVEVRVFRDGLATRDRPTLGLIETRDGQPLSIRQVRESITHLFSLGEFVDVRVSAVRVPRGILLRYDLVPLRATLGVELRGSLGRSQEELLELITSRFGRVVSPTQVPAVVTLLEELYRGSGRFAASVMRVGQPNDDRLVFDIDQGPPANISRIFLQGPLVEDRDRVLARLDLEEGGVYDQNQIEVRLADFEADMRARRFYEARFRHEAIPSADGRAVEVLLDIQTGSPVSISFEGDPVPDASLDELVPVARESSIDEDLLEDSSLRVETHLFSLGYRNARVTHRRLAKPDELSIVFTVDRGPQYLIVGLQFTGNRTLTNTELSELFGVRPRAPVVMTEVEAGVGVVHRRYAQLGYRDVKVQPVLIESEILGGRNPNVVVRVSLEVEIVEGPRTMIGAVRFEGATAFGASELSLVVDSARGEPYYAPLVAADSEAVLIQYLNEGYETAEVDFTTRFDGTGTIADVTFVVREGPQVQVDHVLIVGNRQIAASTIREELPLRPGEALGRDEVDETRRRLTALGLFRRIELREFSHGGGNKRDVVIVVEEAPATRVGYGGGLEVNQRLRATAEGVARGQLEFAPRGFFEIGRRNLWGKNRSIDLFTRVSVRRTDDVEADAPTPSLSFNEYRVLLNYREPRAFRRSGDLLISGFMEQAIRPSFDLFSRGVNAELRHTIESTMTASVGYTYGQNRVTNEQLQPGDRPLVDRLFPDVTLSSFSSGLVRDTRDDPLDPTGGSLVGLDGEAAFRVIGSEVGFTKVTLQGFLYRQLPGDLVFAAGGRLGLARGFARTLTVGTIPISVTNENGVLRSVDSGEPEVVVVEDLPASERFFSGGDTTVRGFALDRLGDGQTIDPNGFPTGGNAMVVLNSELRVPVTGVLQMVGFLDAGNVFDRVSNFALRRIRAGAGFGVRYLSPVGPIRVDIGFKLDRREFAGERERLTALHLSIGQAF